MPDILPVAEGSASITISDHLKVGHRVLTTPQTTIAIPNIATISIVPIVRRKKNPVPWLILIGIVAYFATSIAPAPTWGGGTDYRAIILVLALLAAVITIGVCLSPGERRWRLLISASDGSLNYFTARDRKTLDDVRDLLTEKIDARDTAATFNVDFANGVIQTVEKGAHVGAVIHGSNNEVATNGGRVGTTEVNNSPGAQVGHGNTATGNSYPVDYSALLPVVSEWQSHYMRQGDTDLAQRLSELEQLMRSKTPTPQSKGRLRDLTKELTDLFGGAADVAQFFGSIARLAMV